MLKKGYSLRFSMTFSFIIVTLAAVFLVSVASNFFFEKMFIEYTKKNQERNYIELVSSLGRQHIIGDIWKTRDVTSIGLDAMKNGLFIKVKDKTGKVIWDVNTFNDREWQRVALEIRRTMQARYPDWQGKYQIKKYPLYEGYNIVGYVEIGFYGPFYFNKSDIDFISSLNTLFAMIGVAAIVVSFIIGSIVAKTITEPIVKVIGSAKEIAEGQYGSIEHTKYELNELNHLSEAISDLAGTLKTQDMLRKRLTEDVAHELRTPIATLQSHMEAMIDGIWEPDVKRLQSCHEEIMRIGRLVGDLEKLARYENEELSLNKTKVNMADILRVLIQNFEKDFIDKEVELNYELEDVYIMADSDRIHQVFVNLISNSLKYTDRNGVVDISLERLGSQAKVVIKDNGEGISEEDLPLIFERFYRADRSRSRLTGGAGIGLSIVKAIIENHGGEIVIKSELNKGTEVKVLI